MEDMYSGYEQKDPLTRRVALALFECNYGANGAHSSLKQYSYCFATFPWSSLASVLLFTVCCHGLRSFPIA